MNSNNPKPLNIEAGGLIEYPIPLLGIIAYSGTGKTTLLTKLLPILKAAGLRIAVVKHAQHQFEIDHPHKDSYELRKSGASQMLVASRGRMALIAETDERNEPDLQSTLPHLDHHALDLVLVEGFKHAPIQKIELHRPKLGKPLICQTDPNVIAIATDEAICSLPDSLPVLDLNQPEAIANFISQQLYRFGERPIHDPASHQSTNQLR
ncbi:MAG: molybdopterin-guanine dinucleotide biosynthesis protein B [Candidatus Thiodiazotropha taylori]|nr:molybdopterin-guanine dinucleotide biosynthesis protein B [Candidatus Thiodiazotropha taylori]